MCPGTSPWQERLHRTCEILAVFLIWVSEGCETVACSPSFLARDIRDGRARLAEKRLAARLLVGDANYSIPLFQTQRSLTFAAWLRDEMATVVLIFLAQRLYCQPPTLVRLEVRY